MGASPVPPVPRSVRSRRNGEAIRMLASQHLATPSVATVDGLAIHYDHSVLEPRPWTAEQGRWAAELAAHAPAGRILELCGGAGHIGLVAPRRSGRRLVQVDADPAACRFARQNATVAGLGAQVEVRQAGIDAATLD